MNRRASAGIFIVLVACLSVWWLRHRPVETGSTFVGAAVCSSCHQVEAARWRTSMHARAMAVPSSQSVEAPFAGETFSLHGVTSTFSRRAGKHVVRTDGPDGVLRDFDVAYTFGVYPLQQYLIALPGGRLQALGIAWDARPAPTGGRWFHLYPETRLRPGDELHWTSRSQTWNFMCAECHSTNVRKNYRAADEQYATSWTDVNVACEACHGAGSRHVAWARQRTSHVRVARDDSLTPMSGFDGAVWTMDPATGIAHRNRPRASHVEVETCARCHARRAQLTDDYAAGHPLADSHRPVWLDEDLYFADGQIKGEAYEYGSFLQSRMYANGVTCSDCHEPHRPEVTSRPDDLCQRCHQPQRFATPLHHHHAQASVGSECVSCHMPERTYMRIDVRRDHSFRVPRPDLTVKIGTPNACTTCHANRSASWAVDNVTRWFGTGRSSQPHYGQALAAGRSAAADAESRLVSVVGDATQPAIVRATAVSLLARWIDARSGPILQTALRDPDALVRLAAVDVLGSVPSLRRGLTFLLADPVRAVRIDAARALVTVTDGALTRDDRVSRDTGLAEWEAAQRFNADTAGAHLNLGALYAERGEVDRARQEYLTARRLEPYFAPAAVNLADLDRAAGRDDVGERVLREALARMPEVPALHRALGLLLARRHDLQGAVTELDTAARLAPSDVDTQSTLGVALFSAGRQDDAIDLLDHTWRAHPGDRTVLAALVSYLRERGELAQLEVIATRLVDLSPDDPGARALLNEIRQARAGARSDR
jgi:tetratricopeptide (TPR) repeat protein